MKVGYPPYLVGNCNIDNFLVLILATKWNKIELTNYAKLKINKTYILLYNFSTSFLHNMYCIGKGLDTAHTAGMNNQPSAKLITS